MNQNRPLPVCSLPVCNAPRAREDKLTDTELWLAPIHPILSPGTHLCVDGGRIVWEVVHAAVCGRRGRHRLEVLAEPLQEWQQAVDSTLRVMLRVQQLSCWAIQVGEQHGLHAMQGPCKETAFSVGLWAVPQGMLWRPCTCKYVLHTIWGLSRGPCITPFAFTLTPADRPVGRQGSISMPCVSQEHGSHHVKT